MNSELAGLKLRFIRREPAEVSTVDFVYLARGLPYQAIGRLLERPERLCRCAEVNDDVLHLI